MSVPSRSKTATAGCIRGIVCHSRPRRGLSEHLEGEVVRLPSKQTCALAALACLLVIAPVSAETSWLRALTDAALRQGLDAKLPPHLSVVLGLEAHEQSTPVRQIVARLDHEVRTFNVCSSNHQKLVIMTVNEQTQAVTGRGAQRLQPRTPVLVAPCSTLADGMRRPGRRTRNAAHRQVLCSCRSRAEMMPPDTGFRRALGVQGLAL